MWTGGGQIHCQTQDLGLCLLVIVYYLFSVKYGNFYFLF